MKSGVTDPKSKCKTKTNEAVKVVRNTLNTIEVSLILLIQVQKIFPCWNG